MKTKDNLNIIRAYLPFSLRAAVDNLPEDAQEIRLRTNRPAAVCTPNKRFFINKSFNLSSSFSEDLPVVSQKEINEMFNTICNYSVYSKQNEIINGFITLKGGNRAGICGTCVVENGRIINIRDITSINLRLCSERVGCSENILKTINNVLKGVLLCGVPCSGKTTILRDLARVLSYNYRISLIDSRCEFASVYAGIAQNDVGLCDILDSYSKRYGFEHAVRCLSPEIIICDEIGGTDDIKSILNACKSGVSVIASAHCGSLSELEKKPIFTDLILSRSFGSIVFLDDGDRIGQIKRIVRADELL